MQNLNVAALTIRTAHVVQDVKPSPGAKDPFDYLLLGICRAEQMRLVTLDEKLAGHPLAWRPASA